MQQFVFLKDYIVSDYFAERCASRRTVLFLVKGLDAVTCRIVVPESGFIFVFVKL
jgi:hypothetical protein